MLCNLEGDREVEAAAVRALYRVGRRPNALSENAAHLAAPTDRRGRGSRQRRVVRTSPARRRCHSQSRRRSAGSRGPSRAARSPQRSCACARAPRRRTPACSSPRSRAAADQHTQALAERRLHCRQPALEGVQPPLDLDDGVPLRAGRGVGGERGGLGRREGREV
jgi:hypothetical protein